MNGAAVGVAGHPVKAGDYTGIIVFGLEIAAHVNLPGGAGNDAMDFVEGVWRRVRVVVVIIGCGHEIGDGDHTCGCGEGGTENVGVLKVLLPCVNAGTGRANPEVSTYLRVEDGGEDAGRVEARKAAPVYRAVGSDERC